MGCHAGIDLVAGIDPILMAAANSRRGEILRAIRPRPSKTQ
jgi:hypothetical protein